MASLHKRNDTYHIFFRFQGEQYSRSLKTSDKTTAEGWKANIEETIRDINRGKSTRLPGGGWRVPVAELC